MGASHPRSEHDVNLLTLTFNGLLARIEDVNFTSEDYVDQTGKILRCEIMPVSPHALSSFFWKLHAKIRVTCSPTIPAEDAPPPIQRIFSVRTFCRFYTTVKDQLPSLMSASAVVANLLDADQENERDCIICMDAAVDETLACGHPFCHACIDNWRREHPTCPFCRQSIEDQESYVMLAKPGGFEIATYLTSLRE